MTQTASKIGIPSVAPDQVHTIIGRNMLADGMPLVLDLDKSAGSWIHDSSTGRDYLDFFNYFATQPLGHNHPAMLDPEFVAHMGRVAVTNPSNADFYTTEMAAFVDVLAKTALPKSLPHLFMVAGGSLAVENGLKAAFDWKFQKRAQRGLPDDENLSIIHFKEAFHGRSGYTMSLTNTDPNKVKYFPKFSWPRVANPKVMFPIDEHLPEIEARELESIQEIEAAIEKDGDRIAGMIIEPIQGEGGDNHFRPEFFAQLRRICDENEILLIVDEVQTGVGATGKWWAYQNFGFEPDVLCFGKKMQVCGVLGGPRLDEVDSVFKVSSRINSTWGGNLVDMVRATRYLQVIETEGLLHNAEAMGNRLIEGLHEIEKRTGGEISNVRGRGLFVAFTLASPEHCARFIEKARGKGLLALPSGISSIRYRPPLNVTHDDAEKALEMTEQALG